MLGHLISSYATRIPLHWGKIVSFRTLVRFTGRRPLTSAYKVKMMAEWRDNTSMMSILGYYYDDVYGAVSKIAPGMAFIDIGANAGVFSMVAGKAIGASGVVVAFEPSLPIFARLIVNAQLNKLTSFFPFMAAVGETTGVQRFSPGPEKHTGIGHLSPNGTVEVLQLGGDELMKIILPLIGDRRTMIKIDVEGAELNVIKALDFILHSKQVVTVIAEINAECLDRFGSKFDSIYDRMKAAGFKAVLGRGYKEHYNEIFERL